MAPRGGAGWGVTPILYNECTVAYRLRRKSNLHGVKVNNKAEKPIPSKGGVR